MIITRHYKQRSVTRDETVDNFDEAKRKAKIAWHSGEKIGEVAKENQKLADFMQRKKEQNGRKTTVRLYQGKLYIWVGKKHILVTTYPVSEKLLKGDKVNELSV